MNIRRIATLLTVGGAALALIGVGVGATFTDSATATTNISVGTFGISIASSTSGAVVVNSGNAAHTVTYTAPVIQSSASGSSPLVFTITNTGSMPANITVTSTGVTPATLGFSDALASVTPYQLAVGAHTDFTGGFNWTSLVNADLGASMSITYTISATA